MKCIRLIGPIAAVTAALFLNGCTEKLMGNKKHETASCSVKVVFDKNSPLQKISNRGEIYVTDDDFDTLWGDVHLDSSGFYGELRKIPIGKYRTFGVNIYDSLNMLCYHGENVGSIHAGANDPLHISLTRVTETGSVVVIGEVSENCEPITTISWMGEFSYHPENPKIYCGYYNTTDNNFYLFNGTEWELIKEIQDSPAIQQGYGYDGNKRETYSEKEFQQSLS